MSVTFVQHVRDGLWSDAQTEFMHLIEEKMRLAVAEARTKVFEDDDPEKRLKCPHCKHVFVDVPVDGSAQCPHCEQFFNVTKKEIVAEMGDIMKDESVNEAKEWKLEFEST